MATFKAQFSLEKRIEVASKIKYVRRAGVFLCFLVFLPFFLRLAGPSTQTVCR